jgi:hypothetical protein
MALDQRGTLRATGSAPGGGLSLRTWVALCAGAETIGMTAAATAAKGSQALLGDGGSGAARAGALALVVAGGLVEGLAVGGLQASGLRRRWVTLSVRRWVLVTTVVAGLGWAAASAPATLGAADDTADSAAPPVLLVVAGALVLGGLMGALLGAAQSVVLRGLVPHPRRWVAANAAAWPFVMAVIFLGAGLPGSHWSVLAVVSTGAVTGLLAGTLLGLVTGLLLPTLDGPSAHNLLVLGVLGGPARHLLDRSLVGLRLRGLVSGRTVTLPVQYAAHDDGVVVVPVRPQGKRWWRNLVRPATVELLTDGRWEAGTAVVVHPDDPRFAPAAAAYRARWPKIPLDDDVLVLVRLGTDRLLTG